MKKTKIFIYVTSFICIMITLISVYKSGEKESVSYEFEEIQNTENLPGGELLQNKFDKNDIPTSDLEIPFNSNKKISDFIKGDNIQVVDDFKINTRRLGTFKIKYKYINEEENIVNDSITIKISDTTPPDVWLGRVKNVKTTYTGNLLDDIVCVDDTDDNPKCKIKGYYNTKKRGRYHLTFEAEDKFGNKTSKPFILNVINPSEPPLYLPTNPIPPKIEEVEPQPSRYNISDIIKKHKTNNTKIGIDVSVWQGDIDFQKVKDAGVEFVFIRVGSRLGIEGDYFVDSKFIQNIEGFNKVGIPVGIYFYSYANNPLKSKEEAEWVINQIKDYKVDLPVAFDWESWSFYNAFHMSYNTLAETGEAFLNTIKNAGYKTLLYGSKNYLEKAWYDLDHDEWLAHYAPSTSYKGNYKYWQLTSSGIVPGINGRVDINIFYDK